MQERMMALSERALEMVMRDVLDGLEELALSAALGTGNRGCRVLSITDALDSMRKKTMPPAVKAEVIDLESYRKTAAV
jgi:hypothetical protein